MNKIWIVCTLIIFYVVTSQAGVIWDHPREGGWKFQLPSNDPWYFQNYNSDLNFLSPPDKFSHYSLNYLAAQYLPKRISTSNTIKLLIVLNGIKEFEDGYREGFSVRDMAANIIGATAGFLKQNLICTYDVRERKIFLIYFFPISKIK